MKAGNQQSYRQEILVNNQDTELGDAKATTIRLSLDRDKSDRRSIAEYHQLDIGGLPINPASRLQLYFIWTYAGQTDKKHTMKGWWNP